MRLQYCNCLRIGRRGSGLETRRQTPRHSTLQASWNWSSATAHNMCGTWPPQRQFAYSSRKIHPDLQTRTAVGLRKTNKLGCSAVARGSALGKSRIHCWRVHSPYSTLRYIQSASNLYLVTSAPCIY